MMRRKIFQGLSVPMMTKNFAMIISALKILILKALLAGLVLAVELSKVEQLSHIHLLQLGLIREEK